MISQRETALKLARHWGLTREDLDAVADTLEVERVTDEEWAEMHRDA
ncbi:hypothetical protein [Streptosporangium sp. NPDC087985]